MRLGRRIPNKSMERFNHAKRGRSPCWYVIPVVCTFWIIFLWTYSFDLFAASKEGSLAMRKVGLFMHSSGNPCSGKYIYVHKLPSRFNVDMLKNCQKLNPWTNMCIYLSNAGLGPKLETMDHAFSDSGWYGTNQFSVEVIFHNRMKQYKCLTNDSSLASAIFVPYYAGLDIAQYLWGYNVSMRDSGPLELFDWLRSTPEWNVMGGRDHFFVAGRPTWDFRRISDEESDWGNKLMFLPEGTKMTALLVEVSPWNSNDYGIPYPTYFHPKEDSEVFQWQERMRTLERPWLFSFAGAPRPNLTISIRDKIINQCRSSQQCFLIECGMGESRCHIPSQVMKMFETSTFCLQPQGDSYTRRSTFDSMVAGCIPVFFHPGTAYIQYLWHLPRDYKKYSVFISEDRIRDGNASIEHILAEIPAERVRAMREKVISMVPALLYADPRSQLENVEDAFDVAVDGVIQRVDGLRTEMRGEGNFSRFLEKNSWKYAFAGNEGPHEWDHFFFKPKQCRPCR